MNTINPISAQAMRERAAPGRLALHRTILLWIDNFKTEYGFAPSMRDIGSGLGYAGASTVSYQLAMMEKEGLITRIPRASRTLGISARGRALMTQTVADLSFCANCLSAGCWRRRHRTRRGRRFKLLR